MRAWERERDVAMIDAAEPWSEEKTWTAIPTSSFWHKQWGFCHELIISEKPGVCILQFLHFSGIDPKNFPTSEMLSIDNLPVFSFSTCYLLTHFYALTNIMFTSNFMLQLFSLVGANLNYGKLFDLYRWVELKLQDSTIMINL